MNNVLYRYFLAKIVYLSYPANTIFSDSELPPPSLGGHFLSFFVQKVLREKKKTKKCFSKFI